MAEREQRGEMRGYDAAPEDKTSTVEDMSRILMYNKLRYALPSDLSVIERRSLRVSFAEQQTYTSNGGAEISIRLNASTGYVYGPGSWLSFNLQTVGAGAPPQIVLLNNDATGVFSSLLYESRSGAELCRNEALNRWCRMSGQWHRPADTLSTISAAAGQLASGFPVFGATGVPTIRVYGYNGPVTSYDTQGSALTVCIPLSQMLGVFDREVLIPSALISGSLLRLRLAPPGDAFTVVAPNGTAGPNPSVTSFTITNPRIMLDTLDLSPIIAKNLMEASQSDGGLTYGYIAEYYQNSNPGTSSNFSMQINKAASRALALYWASAPAVQVTRLNADTLGTGACDVKTLSYRVGDLYMPQQQIQVPLIPGDAAGLASIRKNGSELFTNSLASVQRLRSFADPPALTKYKFLETGFPILADGSLNQADGFACHVQCFEQSSALEGSGLAINNSRVAEARIEFVTGTDIAGPRTIHAWLRYMKVAKCSPLMTILKE